MKRLDLHVHTRGSRDAKGSILEVAQAAKGRGLDGVAITDHDACPDMAEIHAAAQATGLLIVPGCESSTIEGHVLCIGITEAPPKGQSLEDVSVHVANQGGVCIAAHPLKVLSGLGPTEVMVHHKQGHVAAAEGINGRDRRIVQDNTMQLLRRLDIPFTGGTDAHWVKDVGTAWTVFPDHVSSTEEVVSAILAGNVHGDGDHLKRRSVWGHRLALPVRGLVRKVRAAKSPAAEGSLVPLVSRDEEEE